MSASNEEEKYAAEATGDANASLTYPLQASALRKGGYALLKSKPCKLIEITTAKPGKHGHAKCAIRGTDIFTGKGVEDTSPSTHTMMVPYVTKTEYDVMDISSDGFLSLLSSEGEEKNDVKLPEGDVGEKITSYLTDNKSVSVTILKAMGLELAIDAKIISE